MSKFLLFGALLWLVGNPILAILIFVVIIYILDLRFVGIFPNIGKPIRRMRSISRLRQQISQSPHDVSAKRELARLLIERKKYTGALTLLEEVLPLSEDSAEFWDDYGTATIGIGQLQAGEERLQKALTLNPRVRYGQPYLRLAIAFRNHDPNKTLHYAEEFSSIQSSSCEAYYLLGTVYQSLNDKVAAKRAYTESIEVYRALPKYKRRKERSWALRSYFRKLLLG